MAISRVGAKPPPLRKPGGDFIDKTMRSLDQNSFGCKPSVTDKVNHSLDHPVTARDLVAPKSPADAPRKLDFSALNGEFQSIWDSSFPNGKAQEQGATLVSDERTGKLKLTNAIPGEAAVFVPDLTLRPGEKLQGIFHTHPYDRGVTGASLSGGDAAYMINNGFNVIIAQSGKDQFLQLRTAATPTEVDQDLLNKTQNDRVRQLVKGGLAFGEATQLAAAETSAKYGLAYYQGTGGVFVRVDSTNGSEEA